MKSLLALLVLSLHAAPSAAVDPQAPVAASESCGSPPPATPVGKLVKAARWGDAALVRSLLEQGAAIDAVDASSATALMSAASFGHLEVVKTLLSAKADPNRRSGEFPTLTFALTKDDAALPVLKALLEAGADPNAKEDEFSMLEYAVFGTGRPDLVRALVKAGADPNRSPALTTAVMQRRWDLIEPLLEGKADPNVVDWRGGPLLNTAVGACAPAGVVKALLKAGADPDRIGKSDKSTPLARARSQGREEIAALLLAAGAREGEPSTGEPPSASEKLKCGVDAGDKKAVRAHLASGGDPKTALDPMSSVDAGILGLLVEAGADPNKTSAYGGSILYWAAADRREDIVKVLLAHGADPEGPDPEHRPLFRAVGRGDLGMTRILLKAKADPNAVDPRWGQGSLHAAIDRGNAAEVDAILASGADLKLKDRCGLTPLDLALKTGRGDIIAKVRRAAP